MAIQNIVKAALEELPTKDQYQVLVEHLIGMADTTYLTIELLDAHHGIVKNRDGEVEWQGFIK